MTNKVSSPSHTIPTFLPCSFKSHQPSLSLSLSLSLSKNSHTFDPSLSIALPRISILTQTMKASTFSPFPFLSDPSHH
ncbi:hypothetical protein RIF29_36385 [Crotalaria pallida]|uniref:Uncharacterized protein n=1 Tax=Crotalaria pallida TaxID=3830 RepID=A0AAN9EB20_CROPI